MSSITEFLLARIAEDEAAAWAATQGPWEVRRGGDFQSIELHDGTLWVTIVDASHQSPPHGEWIDSPDIDFIERYDPVRALAECEAKRAIIRQHEDWPVLVEGNLQMESVTGTGSDDLQSTAFRVSKEMAFMTERIYVKRFGVEPPTTPMIRALAAVYKGHPGYQKEWQ